MLANIVEFNLWTGVYIIHYIFVNYQLRKSLVWRESDVSKFAILFVHFEGKNLDLYPAERRNSTTQFGFVLPNNRAQKLRFYLPYHKCYRYFYMIHFCCFY